ncbi:hypothetical protein GCM10010156_59820 [Planobispora rosea]|uniref:NHLP leader peptide family natural product n=1 Tax=Planobispora rosea TaxID=35762 RepID=A0A8J3S5Q6_PLARO|nr:hypothetical protein [Planobispora rosea]GGS93594.1 hypothetical protein GCM10010156_59820 [Planobispora rosea]GIH87284.1 hypothetical protein Pro02_56920 [Planobispora rosea]
MNNQERAEFVNSYTRLLITLWSNDEFAQRLDTDSRSALSEVGLEVPDGAEIRIVRVEPTGEGSIDNQVALWEAGETSGVYEIHITDTPQVDVSQLSEDELVQIAAGVACCCCTPCCCA